MKQWLMIQNFTALNSMYRKNPGKQATYRSPKGNEKQIDCIISKRRHLKYSKDAEANDMIHMGSDHRCVMATFVINAQTKNGTRDANDNKQRMTTMEERYQELEEETSKRGGRSCKIESETK